MQRRYIPHRCEIIWVILPLIIISVSGSSWAQAFEHRFVSSGRILPDTSPASVDFDGDRIVDPLIVDRTGWQPSVEIYLSRTHVVSSLPVAVSLTVSDSLTVRDLDNDGDSDLFWKERRSLASPDVIVWLNDGTGHFDRPFFLNSRSPPPLPERSIRKDILRIAPHHEVLPSKRVSSPLSFSASDWAWQNRTSRPDVLWAGTPFVSFFTRLPSDRGPPLSH